jgi:hypothetical protein
MQESMLELTPSDPIVKTYLKDLQHLKQQGIVHELSVQVIENGKTAAGWLASVGEG